MLQRTAAPFALLPYWQQQQVLAAGFRQQDN
jgi:hypothetical protein